MESSQHTLYKDLPPDSIRILRIDADPSSSDVGSVKTFNLDKAPLYYALSHTWGPDNRDQAINIDKKAFMVSKSLACALQRLKELAVGSSALNPPVKHVWIDNICINQDDLPERANQVRNMGKVYSKAVRTLVWLGPGFSSYTVAWRLVQDIYDLCRAQNPTAVNEEDIACRNYSPSAHVATGLPQLSSEDWLYMKQLFQLPWFSRVWTVQEVVKSSQDPVVIHGQQSVPWHILAWAATWLKRNGYARLEQIPDEVYNVNAIGLLRRSTASWPLDALLSITQIKYNASDQRDKIYALLGLAAETRETTNMPEALMPDYSIDVRQTYLKVANYLLRQNRSLAFLTRTRETAGSLTRRRRRLEFPDFPSWLPDWSDFTVNGMEIHRSLSWIDYSDPAKPAQLRHPEHYNASAGLPITIHESPDDGILLLETYKVDIVERVVRMNDEDVTNSEFNQNFLSAMTLVLEAALPLLSERHVSSWVEQVIKSTTAEQGRAKGCDYGRCIKDGAAFLCELLSCREGLIPQLGVREQLQYLSVGGEADVYAAEARHYCFNRCFLVTSAGRMGIGPSDTKVYDVVCVIPGGGVPYIIRPNVPTGWLFVGESYICDIMHGETIPAAGEADTVAEILDFH